MESNSIKCPICGSTNQISSKICTNCQSNLRNLDSGTDSLSPEKKIVMNSSMDSKNQNIYTFERLNAKKTKVVAYLHSDQGNTLTIAKAYSGWSLISLLIGMFLVMYALYTFLPLFGFIIIYVVIIYFCLYYLGRITYFDVFSIENKLIGKIRIETNIYNLLPQLKRKNWVFKDNNNETLSVTQFTDNFQGFLIHKNDIYKSESALDTSDGKYYRNILNFQATERSGAKKIIIKNSLLGANNEKGIPQIPDKYEISSSSDLDVRIVVFYSFVILMKFLRIN